LTLKGNLLELVDLLPKLLEQQWEQCTRSLSWIRTRNTISKVVDHSSQLLPESLAKTIGMR